MIPGQPPQKLAELGGDGAGGGDAQGLRRGMTCRSRYAADNPNLLMFEWDKV